MGLLVLLVTTIAVVPLGAQVLRLLRVAPRGVPERFLMSAAVGYVLLAYGILGLGMAGALLPSRLAILLAVCALAGLGHWDLPWEAALRLANTVLRSFRSRNHAFAAGFMIFIMAATLITALEPPTGRDFDGLAEHLAQAGAYIRHHQVAPLWFDHHSHFPATLQMLYALALSFGSVSGAKLFHWFHGLLSVLAVVIISRRFLTRGASGWAGFVLATTPIFLWLCGVAYVDLGATLYGLLAVLGYLRYRESSKPADAVLAGLMAGCAMTVKMQGLALFGVLVLAILVTALRRRGASDAVAPGLRGGLVAGGAAALAGLVIACPWYVRTYMNTGNPFYPFAYGIFGGKHWSAERAADYDRHQLEFGLGDLPPEQERRAMPAWRQMLVGPREPWKWLAGPVALTYLPWEFEVKLGDLQNILLTAFGPLYLAFLLALALIPDRPPAVARILWLFLPLWLWWFASMQLARYLFAYAAMLTPVAGYAAHRCRYGGQWLSKATGVAIAMWVSLVAATTVFLALPALPVVLGQMPRDQYLLATTDVYTPSLYIRERLPAEAVICTYGEVRCFYFDRDYFWGEPGHSDLINYAAMAGPRDLVAAYGQYGITHVLLNQRFLPGLWTADDPLFRQIRAAVDQGYLVPVTSFTTRPEYLLYEVRHTPGGAS